jgi:hypothetical protein
MRLWPALAAQGWNLWLIDEPATARRLGLPRPSRPG